MKDVFTEPKFYDGCQDFLHLFKAMATKTSNEAVVEGMGSVWDKCSEPHRHPQFKNGVEEAVISWSAPASHLPAANPFLRRSLRTYFEGGPEKWNFHHEDTRFRNIVWSGGSKIRDG